VSEEQLYDVVRKYQDTNNPDHNKIILHEVSLQEAKDHCKDPDTHEKGVWFDCFYETGDCEGAWLPKPDQGFLYNPQWDCPKVVI
jgi:hypothetical protein